MSVITVGFPFRGGLPEGRIQTEAMHRTVIEKSEAERTEDFKDFVKDVLSNPNPDLMDD